MVVIIVMVNARPYAAEMCSESLKMASTAAETDRITARYRTFGVIIWKNGLSDFIAVYCGLSLLANIHAPWPK